MAAYKFRASDILPLIAHSASCDKWEQSPYEPEELRTSGPALWFAQEGPLPFLVSPGLPKVRTEDGGPVRAEPISGPSMECDFVMSIPLDIFKPVRDGKCQHVTFTMDGYELSISYK